MGAMLSKDERDYIESNAAASYLLIKHDPARGVDCFNIFDQGGNKMYSIGVIGEYMRSGTESPTLVIYDKSRSAVGTMRWNNESPSSNPFFVRCVDDSGKIYIEYGDRKSLLRKSWYEPSFSNWKLDYHTVYADNGHKRAEISSISNYKKGFRGEKRVRDSYLINRYYNTGKIVNDVLALLFWAIIYICDDYHSIHNDPELVSIRKFSLLTKLEDILYSTINSVVDRKNTIEHRQETAVEELHNRANAYLEDKQARLHEKEESKSTMQQVLSILLSLLIPIAVPVGGYYTTEFINQNLAGSFRVEPLVTSIVLFLVSLLIIGKNSPESVIMYEWIKLIVFCILGLIACVIFAAIMQYCLIQAGINGIDVGLPLILLVIPGICKWMSRYIDRLVDARGKLSSIQFTALGLLLGQVYLQLVDYSRIYLAIASVVAILIVTALSKAKILVRKSVMHCIVGVSVGLLLVCFVEMVVKMLVLQ